jgi:hypothetical protein
LIIVPPMGKFTTDNGVQSSVKAGFPSARAVYFGGDE